MSELRAAGLQASIPEVLNAGRFEFTLGDGTDTVDYSAESGLIAAVVSFAGAAAVVRNVLVSHDGDDDFAEGFAPNVGDRVDLLDSVERIVAAQGGSVIDLTGAAGGVALRYNADDGPTSTEPGLDRDVYRVLLSDPLAGQPFDVPSFLEYRDARATATVTQPAALWTRVEGADHANLVVLTDRDSDASHAFVLRGGANEVNYNELTRSISVNVDEISLFDADAPVSTGLIRAHVRPSDGGGHLLSGVDDTIVSYHAGNGLAPASSLRIEASQDAEDLIGFSDGAQAKLFVIGRELQGSREIEVRFAPGFDGAVQMRLAGFEQLRDSPADDVYLIEDLAHFLGSLALIDTPASDADVLALGNGALQDYADSAPDVLWADGTVELDDLEVAIDDFNGTLGGSFDFDLLDVTQISGNSLKLHNADPDETSVVGDLDLIDDVSGFRALALTDASDGSSFTLDLDNGRLRSGGGTTFFTFDGDVLDASRMTRKLSLTITDHSAAGASLIGGTDDDAMTGGAGDDTLRGGAGDDTLDGGTANEVRYFEVAGILDSDADLVSIDFMGPGGLPALVEGTVALPSGAGSNAVGQAIAAQLRANLAAATAEFQADTGSSASIVDVRFDAVAREIVFTFGNGEQVDDSDLLTFTFDPDHDGNAVDDGGTFALSSQALLTQGGSGGEDTFVFEASAAANGVDRIVGFTVGSGQDDVLDFSRFFDPHSGSLNGTIFVAGSGDEADVNRDVVRFDTDGATLSAAAVAGLFSPTGGRLTEFRSDGLERAVLLEIDGTDAGEDARIWYVADADGDGAIAAGEVALVGVIESGGDLLFGSGNFHLT